MTKLFFTTALVMSALCLQAQTVVSLDKAGTLSEKISSAEKIRDNKPEDIRTAERY